MKNDFLKLKNVFGIVLGGSGLIGQSIVSELVKNQSNILVLDIQKPKIKNSKIKYEYFDCGDIENIEDNLNEILNKYKIPNFFINSSYPKNKEWLNLSIKKIKLNVLREILESNLLSTAWISKIILDKMKLKKKGSLVILNSIYGLYAQNLKLYKNLKIEENFPYIISKGGVSNLIKQLAVNYGSYNIRVNAICPGGVKSFNKKDLTNNKIFIKRYIEDNPIKRFASPSDIAYLCLFLSSEKSEYITGQNLLIDGGRSII